MNRKERWQKIMEKFETAMPMPETELHFTNNFELLVAVILSAQCTDKRVNQVTPALFKTYPTPQDMAEAGAERILPYIQSISYPNNKAKHLAKMAAMLQKDYNGIVPEQGEALERLPGVGRKTANVIQAVAFGKSKMAVDTHVFRVSRRMGLVPLKCKTPLSVEKALTNLIAEESVPKAHHWLILHGRYVCKARKPDCTQCFLVGICAQKGIDFK